MKSKQATSIDQYIAGFPEEVQERLEKVRATIRKAAPGAQEAIKYQIPTFVLNGNLIHFGGFQNHVGLYPGSKAIEEFANELAPYELSKGTVRFPSDKPLPLGLISRITKFCVKRNFERAVSRKGAKAQRKR
jgi:uncharacterized protein YdhG (YjbR/CyaY superfamily)